MSKIGDYIYLNRDYNFNKVYYKKGHKFKIIGSSYRGHDIVDDNGNYIYETLFISTYFDSEKEKRSDKIKEILKKL